MKLLILGGTRFLGRHLAQQALGLGHRVTLLHRGLSGPTLFPEAEHLLADRDKDLSLLDGRRWDAVIDTCAYFPRQVQQVGQVLAGQVGHYQLVSSISVYAQFAATGNDESAPLAVLEDPGTDAVTGATYGGLKALCEGQAQQAFGPRCLVNRPGLLVGPHDPTGRFTWWLQRLQAGGPVLAPGDPAAPVQFIDCRDAAAWMLLQAQAGTVGVANLTGPTRPLTMGGFLQAVRDALAPEARLLWMDEAFLLDHGVTPWTELPVWLPQASAGLHRTVLRRALDSELQCRPLHETILDTARWDKAERAARQAVQPPENPSLLSGAAALPASPPRPSVGMDPKREAALTAAWWARSAADQA
jgi:2'-hydroxyisoflavone reductase